MMMMLAGPEQPYCRHFTAITTDILDQVREEKFDREGTTTVSWEEVGGQKSHVFFLFKKNLLQRQNTNL